LRFPPTELGEPTGPVKRGFVPGCPECGAVLLHVNGCVECRECGYSRCAWPTMTRRHSSGNGVT